MSDIGHAFVTAFRLIASADPEVFDAAGRTLWISISSTLIASLLFVPVGSLIYFHSFPGRRILVNIIHTLFSVPTVLVGLLVYLAFSRAGPLGPLGLLFTPQVMVVGQVVLISPILTGLTISALSGVGQDIRDTAVSLGASRTQAIYTMLREGRYAVSTAILIAFGRALSEVGLAIMVGGNIRGYTRTLTTAMALETSMGNLEISLALGIILLLLALAVSVVVNALQQR